MKTGGGNVKTCDGIDIRKKYRPAILKMELL